MPVVSSSTSTSPKGSAVTWQTLIDDALDLLYRDDERPQQTTLSANATSSDTTLALTAGLTINTPELLEAGQELMLATGGTSTAPVVARAYAATAAAAHTSGDVIYKAPQWSRYKVGKAIWRCLSGPVTAALPSVSTEVITPTDNQYYIPVSGSIVDILRVGYFHPWNYSWIEISDFKLVDYLPTSGITGVTTGAMMTIPRGLPFPQGSGSNPVDLYVTYRQTYTWSGGARTPVVETETVTLPYGAEDLLPLYAAAYMVSGREISRLELDKVEEWNRDEPLRTGTNYRTVNQRWQEFYRRIDEVRRLYPNRVPRHRPFRKFVRGSGASTAWGQQTTWRP